VYEVGIGDDGRACADGTKIGGRDGVRTLCCMVAYSRPGEAIGFRRALPRS